MQKTGRQYVLKTAGTIFLALGLQPTAQAIAPEDLSIHGFGNQGYMQSMDNNYLGTDNNGSWDDSALALLFAAKIDDKSKIWMQWYGTSEKVRLDWAFIDYQLTDNLTARAGQIKSPIGLYTEIRDIRFLQLSVLMPMLYQDASDFAHEAYNGTAVVYKHDFGGGSLIWDAYIGQETNFEGSATTIKNHRLAGGRVTYKTPLDGLELMVSAYSNNKEDTATATQGAQQMWLFSAGYTSDNWDIKTEYANIDNARIDKKSKTYYMQAGYTFAEKWTPYLRYDYITTDTTQSADPSHYQQTNSLGLGYKINSNINMRVENHWNNGYAMPVLSEEVTAGAGKMDWNMFVASINFIF